VKKHLPNALTCGNLLCGCLGIVAAMQQDLSWAAYFIFVGMLFDFLDGLAARLLRAYSEIGKQLDSLADMVTFGVLPSIIVHQLFLKNLATNSLSNTYAYMAFLIAIFSALRLAKFNIDTRQNESFIGLPTPASALVVASLPLIIGQYPDYQSFIYNQVFLISLSILLSGLMVAEIPLFSLKFKNFAWQNNQLRYIFLLLTMGLLLTLGSLALPLIIFIYMGISLIFKDK
jgi:CDP-diacylglycerol---serine O-phosphatidyltransferase